jgi:branched-chain amino acid transport system ATP-binding protein
VGKSTLCHGIAGVRHSRAQGSIQWRGEDLIGLSPDEIVKRGISLVPEGRRIFRRLTVRENLELGRFSLRHSSRRSEGIDLALELFPILNTFANRRAGELSGGQQQMIAIAQAIAGVPTLLILDDPCAGLAESVVDELYRVIHLLREKVGILIVDQVIPRALAQSQRCYVMEAGRIELAGDSVTVSDDPQLERIVMGEIGDGTSEERLSTFAPSDGRGSGPVATP